MVFAVTGANIMKAAGRSALILILHQPDSHRYDRVVRAQDRIWTNNRQHGTWRLGLTSS